ncbi:PorV/PorQ family protein [Candidatus Desantisbacteria bacterium]|nr:PorV/PorQ family protein [Candidatus Desantisbacteria bacterium]
MRLIIAMIIINIMLLFVPPHAEAKGRYTATTSGAFLKLDTGARAAAMGGAGGALIGDPGCVYYNPAGLAGLGTFSLASSHVEWFQDIKQEHLGLSKRLKIGFEEEARDLGVGACNLYFLHMNKIKGTYIIGESNYQPSEEFTASGYLAMFTYACYFSPDALFGVNLKVIREEIEKEDAMAVAFDLGALYRTRIKNLTAGVSLQNMGSEMKFMEKKAALPLTLRGSIGYAMLNKELLLLIDINKPIDNELHIRAGIEYWLTPWLGLRAGYRSDVDTGSGFGGGLGIKLKRQGEEKTTIYKFDYAFVPCGEVGDSHRASLAVEF